MEGCCLAEWADHGVGQAVYYSPLISRQSRQELESAQLSFGNCLTDKRVQPHLGMHIMNQLLDRKFLITDNIFN